jgi:hypothetical protein
LRPGALFKFQVQSSPAVETMDRDTWSGVRFSAVDAVRAARANQLRIEAFDGAGEHYFWLSMRKEPGRGTESDALEQALLAAEAEALNAALAISGEALRELRNGRTKNSRSCALPAAAWSNSTKKVSGFAA